MPKYLIHAVYTAEGVRGLLAEGGTARAGHINALIGGMGGSLESFHYAGPDEAYLVIELPADVTGLALALKVNTSGAVRVTSTPLFTPAQLDEAARTEVAYQPPGAR